MPSEFEKLCRRRTVNNNKLSTLIVKANTTGLTKQQIQLYINQVEQYWQEANQTYSEMCTCAKDDELLQIQIDFEDVEKKYDEERVKLAVLYDTVAATSASKEAKLPKLELPTFSGNPEEWLTFRDLFTVAVHDNPVLKGSQKLQYLLLALKGKAANCVQTTAITDSNYTAAWDRVNKRFNNKREIVKAIIHKLMNQPTIKSECPSALRALIDSTNECVSNLTVLQRAVEQWDDILIYIMCEKLDEDSRREWEMSLTNEEPPAFATLMEFLEQRARALVTIENPKGSTKNSAVKPTSKPTATKSLHVTKSPPKCIVCKEEHPLFRCPKFLAQLVSERVKTVQSNQLCFNCIRRGHTSENCSSELRCKKCNKKHHSLIHYEEKEKSTETPLPTSSITSLVGHQEEKQVLLGTALVKVQDAFGGQQVCRAIIDSGSQVSIVASFCVQRLGLSRRKAQINVTGISGFAAGTSRGRVELHLTSCVTPAFTFGVDAVILPRVTGSTPGVSCTTFNWDHIKSLTLADPKYYESSRVDLLLGADVFASLLLDGRRFGPPDTPTAINTSLGWVIMGPTGSDSSNVQSLVVQSSLDSQLQRFWEVEELPSQQHFTQDEQWCEEHFLQTHRREPSGRYVVELPFKPEHLPLGRSRDRALIRFQQQERRLQNNPEHKKLYIEFMRELQELGHMIPIPMEKQPCQPSESFYLPHHAVFKWNSTTTKCRVVFDASARTSTGVSLNQTMFAGPTLQQSLFSTLLRFRSYNIPFIADVEKMFRMIGVAEHHWNYQRVLWREQPDMPMQEYWLVVLVFGTTCTPFLAVRCLRQCAVDESLRFPKAQQVVLRDFYVDDLMSGESNLPNAIELIHQLQQMLPRGNFNFRKWYTSSPELLQTIPEDLRGTQNMLSLEDDHPVGTLGLHWHLGFDSFKFKVTLPPSHPVITKRTLASDVASLYDPLGWLAPITVLPKDLIRQAWQLKLEWDVPVPAFIGDQWKEFRRALPCIEGIYIPRGISHPNVESIQLCGFSDASERAYSACVYIRVVHGGEELQVELATAKTKIAPVSQKSIPRLELCGALLLVRLIQAVRSSIGLTFTEVHAWTDSKVVLAWVSSCPRRWATFVANRVAAIQEVSEISWHHVPSELNPADCASRGISPTQLSSHTLWWHGPNFLREPLPCPEEAEVEIPERAKEEERATAVAVMVATESPALLSRYSSLHTLVRVTAYILRFPYNSKYSLNQKKNLPTGEKRIGFLTCEELRSAELVWVKLVQLGSFSAEMRYLRKGRELPHESRIKTLNPFLDSDGILRVGGRLQRANLAGDRKFPMLLSRNQQFTDLVIRAEHLRLLHAGAQAVQSSILSRFWIVNSRDSIRRVIGRCVTCVRLRGEVAKQMMGNLPLSRVNSSRPFLNCGVDYAGPFELRVIKGRGHKHYKGYISLFICFATRALHLELVTELTSVAFIAALKRFVARRGKPSAIHSDCGTNFVGASNDLKEFQKLAKSVASHETVSTFLTGEGISWRFNPPGAPHFGGLWEAGVKSVKYHLKRVVGEVTLDYEEFSTVLCQIEACLNSRPLCPMSSDPADLSALTPSHFLVGGVLTAIPEENHLDTPSNRLSRWQLSQKIVQHFWKRWSSEFLSRLQQRPKWWAKQPNLKVGDLVLLKEEQKTPLKWRLGRIEATHPGEDKLVRVVTLRLATGLIRRPIHKLCPLPIDQAEQEENNSAE